MVSFTLIHRCKGILRHKWLRGIWLNVGSNRLLRNIRWRGIVRQQWSRCCIWGRHIGSRSIVGWDIGWYDRALSVDLRLRLDYCRIYSVSCIGWSSRTSVHFVEFSYVRWTKIFDSPDYFRELLCPGCRNSICDARFDFHSIATAVFWEGILVIVHNGVVIIKFAVIIAFVEIDFAKLVPWIWKHILLLVQRNSSSSRERASLSLLPCSFMYNVACRLLWQLTCLAESFFDWGLRRIDHQDNVIPEQRPNVLIQ